MNKKTIKKTNFNIDKSSKPYYEHVVSSIYSILSNNSSPNSLRYCVVKDNGKYLIKNASHSSNKENYAHIIVLQDFEEDLKNHLLSNSTFELKFLNEGTLYRDLFDKLARNLYEYSGSDRKINDDFDPFEPFNRSYSRPSIEEFKKVINCLSPIIISIYPLIRNTPEQDYIIPVMELHNEKFFDSAITKKIKEIIETDISAFDSISFANEDILKDGFNTYLSNKKEQLQKINDKYFEKMLWSKFRKILSHEDWDDIANHLPNLRKKPEELKNLLNISPRPIYCIDIDIDAILDISLTIIDSQELTKVMKKISESINLFKPEYIDFIQFNASNDCMNITMSGLDLKEESAVKVIKLFEKMIYEYNSNNVIKSSSFENENQLYLDKAAETLWLSIELEDINHATVKQKKNKL